MDVENFIIYKKWKWGRNQRHLSALSLDDGGGEGRASVGDGANGERSEAEKGEAWELDHKLRLGWFYNFTL